MAEMNSAIHAVPTVGNRKEVLLFVLSFAVFLVIALAGALLGMPWRSWLPGAEGVGSLLGGVKAAVYTFMSYVI